MTKRYARIVCAGCGEMVSTLHIARAVHERGTTHQRVVESERKRLEQPGYTIAWVSKTTGARGGGTAAVGDRVEAERLAKDSNERWPELMHWAEPVADTFNVSHKLDPQDETAALEQFRELEGS